MGGGGGRRSGVWGITLMLYVTVELSNIQGRGRTLLNFVSQSHTVSQIDCKKDLTFLNVSKTVSPCLQKGVPQNLNSVMGPPSSSYSPHFPDVTTAADYGS